MSYQSQFKGKVIWGTSVYRILLETSFTKLKQDFEGNLTLFERRHERSSYKFQTLQEFISTTRELWKESLRSKSVQDTRLSRWIEEYFNELGISANYQEILDAIRGDFVEVPALEVGETTNLAQNRINELIPPTNEFMSVGTNQKIQGDFDDKEELDKILTNFLSDHKPKRKKAALSTSTFTTSDGQTRTLEDRKEIQDQPLSDEVMLESGINNDFGMEISDISFTDTLPFDYQIKDVQISGVQANKIGEEVTPKGLEVKWHVDKLQPGENAKVDYQLGKRMLRTILIRDDFDLTILQTYENINRQDNSVWVESTYVFQEATTIVENVKILDQIPGDYSLVDSTPDAVPPLAQVSSSNQSTEITWSYTDVPAATQFVLTYELANSPKLLRDRAQVYGQNDDLLLQGVRILRPDKTGTGYGVVLGITALKPVEGSISLKERLPLKTSIRHNDPPLGMIAELDQQGYKEIIWKIDKLEVGQLYETVLHYNLEENYGFEEFTVEIEGKSLIKEDTKEIIKKDEKIVLPSGMYEA